MRRLAFGSEATQNVAPLDGRQTDQASLAVRAGEQDREIASPSSSRRR
jgi:hypothetical protein